MRCRLKNRQEYMEIEQIIKTVGFRPKEVKIYLALLELGQASTSQIAQKAGLKRTTLYPILEGLLAQNYLAQIKQKNRSLYTPEPPEKILEMLKYREGQFRKILPELRALTNLNEKKPKIYYFEGQEACRAIYDDTLNQPKGSTMYEYISIQNAWQYMPADYAQSYINRRIKARIKNKIIAVDSPEAREWLKNARQELREIILIPPTSEKITTGFDIYGGNKMHLVSWQENFMGIIIESEQIYKMQKIAFDLMWEQAKRVAVDKFIVE